MNSFSEMVFRAIADYKKLLKRKLPSDKYSLALQQMGIKRLQLKNLNESSLLQVVNKILHDLETSYNNYNNKQALYSGIQEFVEHLKGIIKSYHINNNIVINPTQKASAILLDAIQLISLPNSEITAATVRSLEVCVENLIHYGTASQITMMINALKKQGSEKMDFCSMLLQRLEVHLRELTTHPQQQTDEI